MNFRQVEVAEQNRNLLLGNKSMINEKEIKMNNNLKTRYKQILENKIQINEMRAGAGGWWERIKYLFPWFRRFKDIKQLREYIARFSMGGTEPFRRLILKFGRGTSKNLDNVIDELNHNLGNTLGGDVHSIIIQDDGAHILVVGSPPRYFYANPQEGPVYLPNFDPYNDTVPGHVPWILPDGSENPHYHSPFEGVLPGQGAGKPTGGQGNPLPGLGGIVGGVLVLGNEYAYGDPYSPSNQPGWHPPMLPPIQPPTPPWYSPLAPMDPSQPNFGIPGY